MLLPARKYLSLASAMLHPVSSHFAIADIAALIGEPTRAAMLLALLDGSALPAGELARRAGLSAAATSLHLAKLTRAELLIVHQEGRHRYYRLGGPDVAHALEALGTVATKSTPARAISSERAALRVARSCYDHLAGTIAVGLTRKLEREEMLRTSDARKIEVTVPGARWLRETFSIDVTSLVLGRRPLARSCLDWTERKPHLAGALGAAILQRLFAMRWVASMPNTRALRVTTRGEERFFALGLATTRQ
jgi:DNA-binding transcriptional ArsR family regulator